MRLLWFSQHVRVHARTENDLRFAAFLLTFCFMRMYLLTHTEPLWGTLFAVLLLNEAVTPETILGLFLSRSRLCASLHTGVTRAISNFSAQQPPVMQLHMSLLI